MKIILQVIFALVIFNVPLYAQEPRKLIEIETYYPSLKNKKQRFEVYQVFNNAISEKAGFYKQYSPYGDLEIEGNFANNIKTGEWKYYHQNSLDSSVNYKMGLKDGKFTSYYYSSTLKKKEGVYKSNIQTGKWEYFKNDAENSLDAVLYFNSEGQREGTCTTYYKPGKVECIASYSQGRKTGTWTRYDEDGNKSILEYKNGESSELGKDANGNEIFDRAEVMPQFYGGYPELFKFLQKSIRYPMEARENGLEGKVILKFYVDELGFVRDIQVVKDGVGGGCSEESIRVVKEMPRWQPGVQRGKLVNVYYMLPITYKLQ